MHYAILAGLILWPIAFIWAIRSLRQLPGAVRDFFTLLASAVKKTAAIQ